ncbi:MAG: bifunctional 5,10-methylene-tetrahydrofolate dehydrogenase/5,10-methylene-tetrahydrofolate cyclohydrolase [candidate division Zixibacteria bacterium]|nr:bifunctional 5,10-methylene-tetrahydrofolate dehydrogenase/5,10-methylene-tetrahydrofolate cyclohydrolase [candidate division Zixibacteria bacterium]
MNAVLIDGKKIAGDIKSEIQKEVLKLKSSGVTPGLATVLVGDNPASHQYVNMKVKACQELGIFSEKIVKPNDFPQSELLSLIDSLNRRDDIHGILVQSPLPDHIDEGKAILRISPTKDVDGFHPINQGLMLAGKPRFLPATPFGIVELLYRSGYNPSGKHVVVLGRGYLVGRPVAALLAMKWEKGNATVTVCHTGTPNISHFTKQADIIIAAIGQPRYLKADMVKPGAVVIDVGTNRIADPTHPKGLRTVGDVDFDSVKEIAGAITPVPGGVGPMTIAMLLTNTLKAARKDFAYD